MASEDVLKVLVRGNSITFTTPEGTAYFKNKSKFINGLVKGQRTFEAPLSNDLTKEINKEIAIETAQEVEQAHKDHSTLIEVPTLQELQQEKYAEMGV